MAGTMQAEPYAVYSSDNHTLYFTQRNGLCTSLSAGDRFTPENGSSSLNPTWWYQLESLNQEKPYWEESPAGANCGGWGLYLKTEDMAKMGQLLLQEGKWKGKQILPAEWVREASSRLVWSVPSMLTPELCSKIIDDTNEFMQWIKNKLSI